MLLVSAICTQCGAVLKVDAAKDAAICQHCGAAFVVEKAINAYTVHNHIKADTVNVCNQKEFVIRAGVLEKYQGEATDIVVPDGVVAIGKEAFAGCFGLRRVQLPVGIERIDLAAFSGCAKLESINLPEGLKVIDSKAFFYCESLHCISLPSTLTFVGTEAFQGTGLTEITIPESVAIIHEHAFGTRLEKLVFKGHPTLMREAFASCLLKSIVGRDVFDPEDEYAFKGTELVMTKIYKQQNRCAHCGGYFKGLLFRKCTGCGKLKDY